MSKYSKSLHPLDGEAFLETPDGLKYWLVSNKRSPGLMSSVLTEDPSIAMHHYAPAGPGGPYDSYLFSYKGTNIGFIDHPFDGEIPLTAKMAGKKTPPISFEDRISSMLIFAVGAPVYDRSYGYKKDANGEFIKDRNGRFVRMNSFWDGKPDYSKMWVTGLNWLQFGQGQRDKFPSLQIQDEMVALWPALCDGFSKLREMEPNYTGILPDGSPAWRARMRFDESVLKQFESGELINN